MLKLSILLLLFPLLLLNCSVIKQQAVSSEILTAADLNPFGRHRFNNDRQLELISSAANFGVSFSGEEIQLFASGPNSDGHNYLQYELDGVYQKRIKVNGGVTTPISIRTLTKGPHTLWIYKATEAHSGPLVIEKLIGSKLISLSRPVAPLIEFIGNSITCGAAADFSEIPCDSGEYMDHHNAYLSYGPGVARALKANFIMNCVSGIGIYRNWNSDGPAMPQVFNKIDFMETSESDWNASAYNPDIISIALGTNDLSDGDGIKTRLQFDSSLFVTQYISFVKKIKESHPTSQITLLSSPMLNGRKRTLLQNCLAEVKAEIDQFYSGQNPVQLYFFKPMIARGCSGHPSVDDHALLAKELTPFFKSLLKESR